MCQSLEVQMYIVLLFSPVLPGVSSFGLYGLRCQIYEDMHKECTRRSNNAYFTEQKLICYGENYADF